MLVTGPDKSSCRRKTLFIVSGLWTNKILKPYSLQLMSDGQFNLILNFRRHPFSSLLTFVGPVDPKHFA